MQNRLIINNDKIRKISLFLIIFQSIGIRFFSGIGIFLLLIIFLLNVNNLKKINFINHKILLLLSIFLICLIFFFKHLNFFSILYILFVILDTLLVLINYLNKTRIFLKDIYPLLWFFSVYGFVCWSLFYLFPFLFKNVNFGLNYATFLYIFYNNSTASYIPRLSSLFWEPGCTQFILNFLLLILINTNEKFYKILFISFLILLTQSTTGYINLILIYTYYFLNEKKRIIPVICILVPLSIIGINSIITNNIIDKFNDSSGIIRMRDFYVGYKLSLSYPVLGVDSENLSLNPEAQILEDEIWGGSQFWTDYQGYFAGGYTNGLMGVFLDYGIILGIWLLYLVYKSPLIWNNKTSINPILFILIFLFSMTSEPISRTTLFFLFALSSLVIKSNLFINSKRKIINNRELSYF